MPPVTSKPRRLKVKSGCRKCKIRKVKCDEGRPACDRCFSTGRVCDGYGVWGGGGNGFGSRPAGPRPCEAVLPHRGLSPIGGGSSSKITAAEQDCFEWFSCKAATKLQGIFCITFWSQLLPQACLNEPAIMHASLALSSTHQKNVINSSDVDPLLSSVPPSGEDRCVLDKSDEFTLVQYSKAIQQLQPHLATAGKSSSAASIRVALIACLVFANLEFLNSRYNIGIAHLHSGLKLLGEFQGYALDGDEPVLVLKPPRDFVDEWIADTLTKLLVQANLHGAQGMPYPRLVMRITTTPLPSFTFHTVTEARQHLDQLFNDVLYLAEDSRRLRTSTSSSGNTKHSDIEKRKLTRRQIKILTGLHTWHSTYTASRSLMKSTLSPFTHYGYLLLLSMYHQAQIMAAVCLTADETEAEAVYDAHAASFLAIVRHSSELRRLVRYEAHYNPLVQYTSKIAQSTADMGWIPPLYYTALKCRARRVRLHALRFLGFKPHKEGIWDTEVAAIVVREVIRLEEGGGGDDVRSISRITDPAVAVEVPTEEELVGIPTVPVARRLHDFHLRLPDDLAGKIVIRYRQGPRSSGALLCIGEYDLLKRKWEDGWSEQRSYKSI
ncbi:C6 zinc finger domain-containing protein [Apiospora phragmitis]|uniref:C6 zinc finger domain-containing protein n=1 Tax=Apiospora phragmitis TaxID=2905665 RepID=A0ABR1T9D0_9PEZI